MFQKNAKKTYGSIVEVFFSVPVSDDFFTDDFFSDDFFSDDLHTYYLVISVFLFNLLKNFLR